MIVKTKSILNNFNRKKNAYGYEKIKNNVDLKKE